MTIRAPACRTVRALGAGLASIFVLGLSWSAAAEYRLRAGDVIEISVAGLSQANGRASVQLDGTIAVPMIGTLEVEGSTMMAVRERIRSAFASRLLSLYTPDGSEVMRTVAPEDVAAAIVQYAPVWVSGDVVRAGEQPFHARMTVRQAIASAGGLRMAASGAVGPTYDAVTLENEYIAAWLATAGHAARAWRLHSELGDGRDFDRSALPPPPVPEGILSRLVEAETQIARLRQQDHDREKSFLERSIALAEEQMASLSRRLDIEGQGELDDQKEYERAQELLRKGSLTNDRVANARRALLYSSTRRLQTANELMQVERRLGELRRAMEKLDDHRRISIQEELRAAELKLAAERARLQSLDTKLSRAGLPGPSAAGPMADPEISVIRRANGKPAIIAAGYDDEIQPGDVVEVRFGRTHAPVIDGHSAQSGRFAQPPLEVRDADGFYGFDLAGQ